ncbi:MAG: hypothetical protein IT182_18665 [Acidobacteria bacterium]|nr:hypothetical protein [Acidobacteriota bacterium]
MFHFTHALSTLVADIVSRVPAMAHVQTERTLVFARRGRSGADGPNATCHCLTLPASEPGYYYWADAETGALTRRSPWFVTRSPRVVIQDTPIDYMISVALPRFSDQVSRRKRERYPGLPPWVGRLDTVVHELYHIAPDASGLRLLTRPDGTADHRAHPPQFFDDVRDLVRAYLDTSPCADVLEVVQHDFATLVARHGQVVGTTFRDASYPQRYVDVLADQPTEPTVPVEPLKEPPGRALFTDADLVVRDFSRARQPVVPTCAA